MLQAEKKIVDFISGKSLIIYMFIVVVLSALLRLSLFGYVSGDMSYYLLAWYGQIEQLGGMKALRVQVGNYNVLYQTIIAIMTYIPGEAIVKYKLVSCFFDYVVAIAAFLILYEKGNDDSKKDALIAFVLALFSPIVFLNSGAWGQCDAIYTSFVLLSLCMYRKQKYGLCFGLFGIAFAFKLQAIFYLPFFLFEWVRTKNFSVVKFLYVPLTMIVVCIPAYINGRNFLGFISPYYYQTESCNKMSFNYPSFWTIMSGTDERRLDYITNMKLPAIIITFVILAGIMVIALKNKKKLSDWKIYEMFLVMGFTCVEFLPGMHERYGFPVEILAIILAFKDRKTILMALTINVITIITYGCELFGGEMNISMLGIFNFMAYCGYLYVILHDRSSFEVV